VTACLVRARETVFIRPGLPWLLLLTFTACAPKPETVTEIRRGRLHCTEMVERRRVNNYWWEVFVDDRPFNLPQINSNKAGQCQASNNPEAMALVLLFGDSCWAFHLEGERPVVVPLARPEGMDAIEQYKTAEFACAGRCLVWPTQMTFLDTNETRKFSRLPSRFIAFSPDLRTAITEGTNDYEHDRISVNVVDMQTGKVNERILPQAKYLWLLDYTDRAEGIAAHFKWERGADGKDQLAYPAEEEPKQRK